eukprot:TRINITY_DN2943_c0_g1_i12.p1 TRINITY_DN2943_c0_g1~~TRINITY_DN2943_c0_g1_i12.p1  ORF type:complete len:475 (+),score=91.64 TRINITY_DN2943_c0_g1_i12:1275-2699(+)
MRDGSNEEIVKALVKRLEKSNWAVVLKALMIFHRCFKNGDPSFMESLKSRSNMIFSLRGFSQLAPPNHIFTVFVKKYAKYLEEKVSVLRLLSFQFENTKDVCKDIKSPRAFKVVPKLQSQLNALLNCKMRSQNSTINSLISRTYVMLLTDSLSLYSTLNDGITCLMEQFWKMNKKDSSKVLDIYNLFIKETDALISLYDIGKRFVNKLPTVNKAETAIVPAMEDYVANASDKTAVGEEEEHSDEQKDQSNLVIQQGNYDESDYEDTDQESQGSTSSGEDDEPDPFESFIQGTNNPFANFSFNQPVVPASFQGPHVSVHLPVGVQTNNNNPYVTNNNPFQTVNPFATQQVTTASPAGQPVLGNPFATYTQAPVVSSGSNPFLTVAQGTPSFGNPSNPSTLFYTNVPVTNTTANPFATRTSANPFASNTAGVNIFASNTTGANPFASNTVAVNPFATNISPANPFGTQNQTANPFV